jgi:hypothetical protein
MGGSRNLGKKFPDRKPRDVRNQSHVRPGEEPEEALWRHVILQAIDDATKPLTETQMKQGTVRLDRLRAREWLLGDSERFRMACALAGANIEQVRAHVRKLIEQADAQQQAAMDGIKATAMSLVANQQQQVSDLLTSTMPGVVENFQMEAQDRRTSFARDPVQIDFSSQNNNSTQDQTLSPQTSKVTIRVVTFIGELRCE